MAREQFFKISIEFRDFNGERKWTCGTIEGRPTMLDEPTVEWYVRGDLGCGKTRTDRAAAVKEYLGGRELIQHVIHD